MVRRLASDRAVEAWSPGSFTGSLLDRFASEDLRKVFSLSLVRRFLSVLLAAFNRA